MPPSAKRETAICAICRNEFVKAHHRALYCSRPCFWKSKNQRVPVEKRRAYNRAKYWRDPDKARAQVRASATKFREARLALRRGQFQKERLAAPWRSLLSSSKERAAKKRISFSLTEEWAASRWTGKCELTGIEFRLGQRGPGPKPYSPSIDRINPTIGYDPDNCRFVLHTVNAMKGTLSDEEMYEIAEALLKQRQ